MDGDLVAMMVLKSSIVKYLSLGRQVSRLAIGANHCNRETLGEIGGGIFWFHYLRPFWASKRTLRV